MKIVQKQFLTLNNTKEYVVIPYIKEEGMKVEWLKSLLPFNCNFPVDAFTEEKGRAFIQVENTWIQLEFLPIIREKQNVIEDLKEAFGAFGKKNKQHCQILLEHLALEGLEKEDLMWLITQAILEGSYHFNKKYLTQINAQNIFQMRDQLTDEKETLEVTFVLTKDCKKAIEKGMLYGKAINRARTLSNLPNNYLHVKEFTAYAKNLADYYGLECKVLGNEALEEIHSGGILSVNAGSSEEAHLIVLHYKGNDRHSVSAVIGKGVMFDAGGYHLKSLEGMDGMKYDMCGAANALAVIEIIACLKSKSNVMVVIPAVENVLSDKATKMGDVITTMSGKTVEVWNTDAEGRLILCDALTYAIREGATQLIDLATLTYSCQNALGSEISGIFSSCEDFYEAFITETKRTGEKVWRLPLDAIYHKLLKHTETADLINYAPGCGGGASVAACFLEEFIEEDIPWIHLDVVGTAVCKSERADKEKGATGVLVSTIASFIENAKHQI